MRSTARSLSLLLLALTIKQSLVEAQDRDMILRMTTPIEVHFKDSVPHFGSAFYFQKLGAPADPAKAEPQWRATQALYLVTAKHVIEPTRIKNLNSITFYLRKPGTVGVEWLPITLSPQEVRKRLHVSPNPVVDVAALDVLDLVEAEIMKLVPKAPERVEGGMVPIEPFGAVMEDNFVGKSKIKVSAGDDIVVIGYPRQFFDRYNKLPILKSGLLITPTGVRYDNMDAFLIDFKEYEGLSGSAVIGKPTDLVVDNGQIFVNKEGKDFAFLGVYTGQRYKRSRATGEEKTADLGICWYYYNLNDAVNAPPLFAPK